MKPQELQDTRKALGMTQKALAAALGMTVRTLSRYETGESPIPTALAGQVAQVAKRLPPAPKVLAITDGQITPARHRQLFLQNSKGAVVRFGPYHPCELFPDLPWPRDEAGYIPWDAAPAWLLATPQYHAACEASYQAGIAEWGPNGARRLAWWAKDVAALNPANKPVDNFASKHLTNV